MNRLLLFLALWAAAPLAAATEIRLWHAMNGAQGEALEALAAKFNAAQPDWRVVPIYKGSHASYSALAERRKGFAPHLVQADETRTADLALRADVRPLWEVLAHAQQPAEAKVVPALAAPFSDAQGRLLALPLEAATPILYYSRDAFRRARLDPEPALRTWYEMANTLGALLDSGEACGYTTAWPAWVLLENMSAWHNQAFATRGGAGAGPRLALNNRLLVRWISMLASWRKAGYFAPSGRGDEAEARFAAGECAVLTSSSASYERLRQHARFDVGVAPLPYFDDFEAAPQNTLVRGGALWVLAGRSAAEYAGVARFADFVLRSDVQAEWHQRTGNVPLTRVAYELTRAQGFYRRQPGYEVAVRQLVARDPTPESEIRLPGLPRIRIIANEELEAVWSGGKTPVEALDAAVTRGNVLLHYAK